MSCCYQEGKTVIVDDESIKTEIIEQYQYW